MSDKVKTEIKEEEDSEEDEDKDGVKKSSQGIRCEHCDYTTTSKERAKKQLNGHMNEVHGQLKLPCHRCDKTFWSEKQRQSHTMTHTHQTHSDGTFHCDQCDFKGKKACHVRVHINSVHLKMKPHLCDFCPSAFPTKSALSAHRNTHTNERIFPCTFCEKKFTKKCNMVTHIRTHTGEKPFTCEECGKSFSDQAYFAVHQRTHLLGEDGKKSKSEKKLSYCHICGKGLSSEKCLKRHLIKKHDNSSEKLRKPKKFSSIYSNEFILSAMEKVKEIGMSRTSKELDVNISTLKNWKYLTLYPETCPDCGKAFPYKSQLRRHLEEVHRKTPDGEALVNEKNMSKSTEKLPSPLTGELADMKEVHGNNVDSDAGNLDRDCGVEKDWSNETYKHKQDVNENEKYHEAKAEQYLTTDYFKPDPDSGVDIPDVPETKTTMPINEEEPTLDYFKSDPDSDVVDQDVPETKTTIPIIEEEPTEEKSKDISNSEAEPVVCIKCGRQYENMKRLRYHMKVHTKSYLEGKYTCDICGKEYRSNVSLQNHINTFHKGQRDFPCDICGKLFSRYNTLKTHRKIHDGIKQFHCIYCGTAYGEKRNLMNHIKRSHPECELKFKRLTPDGTVIMDNKSSLKSLCDISL